MADVITAVGASVGVVLGGVAAVLAAGARTHAREAHREVTSVNGRTLAETASRIEADTLEQTAKLEEIDRKVEGGGA